VAKTSLITDAAQLKRGRATAAQPNAIPAALDAAAMVSMKFPPASIAVGARL
jgi:hypothetical protein